MQIISAKLSGKAKSKDRPTRTEGLKQNSSQGQSIDGETAMQNIIHPRVRTISLGDEKICRYSIEKWRFRIKNLMQQMVQVFSSNSVSGTADADEAGYLYHKSAVIHARQQDIKVEKDFSVTALADQVVAHTIYGAVLAFGDRVYEYHNV